MPREIKTLTDEECEKLLLSLKNDESLCPGYHKRHRNFLIGVLLLDTGIRVGELVALKTADLYFMQSPVPNLIVRAEIAKNHKERTIPTSIRLQKALYWHLEHSLCDENKRVPLYPFISRISNRPMGIRQVQRIMEIHSVRVLGRKISPHTLRHTFGTRTLKRSNLRVTQMLLGHSNIQTTTIYTHPDHNDLKKAIHGP